MRVAFRADASLQIGAGHVVRCKTLADELHNRGAEVRFVCSGLSGNLVRLLEEAGYQAIILRSGLESPDDALAGSAVGAKAQSVDAMQTIHELAQFEVDWLVVDHYQLDAEWESLLRPHARHLLVIDDLADRKHDCDALVDPTYGETAERYEGLVSTDTNCMCGSQYALLRPQFLAHRPTCAKSIPQMQEMRLHVFFGSTDLANHTRRFSDLLLRDFAGLQISAVVGRDYGFQDQLRALSEAHRGRFSWQSDVRDMAASMAACHVAFGAPGGATWERAALGLPAVYLTVSSSQEKILERLDANGLCSYLGAADQITDDAFLEGMRAFLTDAKSLEDMGARGLQAIDAKGVQRIADLMEERL